MVGRQPAMGEGRFRYTEFMPGDGKNRMLDESGIRDFLRSEGIRPTAQRVSIANVLFAKQQHLSAEEVRIVVNRRGGEASLATVYNTLNLFAARGFLRQVVVDLRRVFYDSNISRHHHFYNEDTGELSDFPAEEMCITRMPVSPAETVRTGVDIIIRIRGK